MADEDLEQRREGELPADLKGAFDEQGRTVIPGYQAPAVDPDDARTDVDAEASELETDAAADEAALGGNDPGSGDGDGDSADDEGNAP
ncbi:MAG: hypothetical protein ACRDJU_09680 [Actinomycetota bacterium]